MSLLEAIVMGIIQGVTEFLPVSSSGHLAIFKNLFGLQEAGLLFDILLHVGTLAAVCVAFFGDIRKLFVESIGILADVCINGFTFFRRLFTGREIKYRKIVYCSYRKFVLLILVSTIPTGIIGVVAKDLIEAAGSILLIPGICLMITGAMLFLADRLPEGTKTPKRTSYTNAFLIGTAQGIATLPGISRSGTTLFACLANRLDRKFAVKYSFIMSIPAILGAAVLEVKDALAEQVSGQEWVYYLSGTLVAALVGYICIKTMLVVVRDKKFKYFAVYCALMGVVSIVAFFVTP